jgi:hypothetical protein
MNKTKIDTAAIYSNRKAQLRKALLNPLIEADDDAEPTQANAKLDPAAIYAARKKQNSQPTE